MTEEVAKLGERKFATTSERIVYRRQEDLFPLESVRDTAITVIGAGSLGSWAVLGLTKLGMANVTVYDNDKAEEHNMPNQLFGKASIGMPKAQALDYIISDLSPEDLSMWHNEEFLRQKLSTVVVSLVDSMDTRQAILKRCIDNEGVKFFVDARMGGTQYKVYCLDPNDPVQVARYWKNWHPDSESAPQMCTARGIVYNAVSCAMDVVNVIATAIQGKRYPWEIFYNSTGFHKEVNWQEV